MLHGFLNTNLAFVLGHSWEKIWEALKENPFLYGNSNFQHASISIKIGMYPDYESEVIFPKLTGIRPSFTQNFDFFWICNFFENLVWKLIKCQIILEIWLQIHSQRPKRRVNTEFYLNWSMLKTWVSIQNRLSSSVSQIFFSNAYPK